MKGFSPQFLFRLCSLGLILSSCEPRYNPISYDDVPSSPGSAWREENFKVKKTAENPFTVEDLTQTMPLAFLLDMALYNNPLTRSSWNAARASAYGYRASLSSYYPSLFYSGTLGAQTNKGSSFASSGSGIVTNPTDTTVDSHMVNQTNQLTLTYLLLDFGGRRANADFALQALYASNWQHNLTMQQVMLSLLTAYTGYQGNKSLVNAYKKNLQDAETVLKASQALKAAGIATQTDVLLAQSNVEQIRTLVFQAEGAEKTSIGEILIAVGLPPDSPISVVDLPQQLPVVEISENISELLETAKRNRPDLGIAISAIKQQEAQLALSYSNSMPLLTANANWNQVRFISPRRPSGYNETAFLQLDIPIFEGFYYMNQQRQLRAQVETALADLDVQVAAISLQVITNYYSFRASEASLPSTEAAVLSSERAYKGFVVQYKTGTASVIDVLNALTILTNARAQQVLNRTQWATSLANLAYSIGILNDNSGRFKKGPPKNLSTYTEHPELERE